MSSTKSSSVSSTLSIAGKPSKKKRKQSPHANVDVRLIDIGVVKGSPSVFELQIQKDRVLYILSRITQKLQLAFSLHKLLKHNACLLSEYVPHSDVEFILGVCVKYAEEITSVSRYHLKKCTLARTHIIDNISMKVTNKLVHKPLLSFKTESNQNITDPHMADVMDTLWKNLPLREHVVKTYSYFPERNDVVLINSIKNLIDVAEKKLSITASEAKARAKRLRKAWTVNSEFGDYISATNVALEKQRDDLGRQMKNKELMVKQYTKKIHELKTKFKDNFLRIMYGSEKSMADDTRASGLREQNLSAETKTITHQYERLLHQHLIHEKKLKNKKSRIETQLAAWLSKYDADIGERLAEFEEITKGFKEEKAEFAALQIRFNEQEVEYMALMKEKEEEERKILEAKAYLLLCDRSARKIQRYWRAHVKRKLERKGRKGKPKKEKSKDVAERASASAKTSSPKEEKSDAIQKGKSAVEGKPDVSGVTGVQME